MEYKRFSDTIVVRLDPGEEILEQLADVAKREHVSLAQVSGLGAVNDFIVGVLDLTQKQFKPNHFQGAYEVTSLQGSITAKDGVPYLHLHMSAGDEMGQVVGGHLNRAVISVTGEIFLRVIEGTVNRKFSEDVGINIFSF